VRSVSLCAVGVCLAALGWTVTAGTARAAVPWATSVVQYDYDGDGNPSNDYEFVDPQAALGAPTRMTNPAYWPMVASLFNGPYMPDEIVGVKAGGQLVVGFDQPIVHDPSHLYGVDLIVFGHAMFNDGPPWTGESISANPSLFTGNTPGVVHAGVIEVSRDGTDWRTVPNVYANTMYPTVGYLDSGAYDAVPGLVPSDFLKPVNPALQLSDFAGLTYAQAVALYDGSGGGTPVDISSAGLDVVNFVRITVPQGATYSVEVDAFAVVPEPMSLLLLGCGAVVVLRRKAR
jgi:hypothetical protein